MRVNCEILHFMDVCIDLPKDICYSVNIMKITKYPEVESYRALPSDVVDGIILCATQAFDNPGHPMGAEEILGHIQGDLVTVVQRHRQVVGFASACLVSAAKRFQDERLPDDVGCYFAGAAVSKSQQGQGVYHTLNASRIEFAVEHGLPTIFTQTQNPRVHEGITHSFEMLGVRAVEVTRVVRPGVYGRMLTGKRPTSRTLEYNDLDYPRGDAAVITWRLG